MESLKNLLVSLDDALLAGMRRGIEKESLRARADGTLAMTPHPQALGSPLTHSHITTDFSESQLEALVTPGEAADCKAYDTLIDLPEQAPDALLADKAYDSNAIRAYIERRGGIAVIPPRANRKEAIEYSSAIGKARHEIENFFARIKRYRRISTRYDKRPDTYLGFVTLAASIEWIKFEFVHAA